MADVNKLIGLDRDPETFIYNLTSLHVSHAEFFIIQATQPEQVVFIFFKTEGCFYEWKM